MDQQLISILSDISNSLKSIPFWKNFVFWNVVVLAFTLFFLIRYTRATKQMAKNQLMPAIEVNMIYDSAVKKTYFWFLNASSIPAFVLIKYNINEGEKKSEIQKLRISPYHPQYPQFKKTATTFLDFFNGDPPDGTKVTLDIIITPAFKKNRIKFNFIKSYKFKRPELRWNEITWGYPDPLFP